MTNLSVGLRTITCLVHCKGERSLAQFLVEQAKLFKYFGTHNFIHIVIPYVIWGSHGRECEWDVRPCVVPDYTVAHPVRQSFSWLRRGSGTNKWTWTYIINITCLLHVSPTRVAIFRELHYKGWVYRYITKVRESKQRFIVLYCIVVGSRRLMPPHALQPKAYCTNPGL